MESQIRSESPGGECEKMPACESPAPDDLTTARGFANAANRWNERALRGDIQPFELAQAIAGLKTAREIILAAQSEDCFSRRLMAEIEERKRTEKKLAEFCERTLNVVEELGKKLASTSANVQGAVDLIHELDGNLTEVIHRVDLVDVEAGERIQRLEAQSVASQCSTGLLVLDSMMTSQRVDAIVRAGQTLERNVANLDLATRKALEVADRQFVCLDSRVNAAEMNDGIRRNDIQKFGEQLADHKRRSFDSSIQWHSKFNRLDNRVAALEPKQEELRKFTGSSMRVTIVSPDGKRTPLGTFDPPFFGHTHHVSSDWNCKRCRHENGHAFFLTPPPHTCGKLTVR